MGARWPSRVVLGAAVGVLASACGSPPEEAALPDSTPCEQRLASGASLDTERDGIVLGVERTRRGVTVTTENRSDRAAGVGNIIELDIWDPETGTWVAVDPDVGFTADEFGLAPGEEARAVRLGGLEDQACHRVARSVDSQHLEVVFVW